MLHFRSVCLVFITFLYFIFSFQLSRVSYIVKSLNRLQTTRLYARDTIIQAKSTYEARCSLSSDIGINLSQYMSMPVDQYVCIKMPLGAALTRTAQNMFNLTVPPVRFFYLDVSPTINCHVSQTNDSIVIEGRECVVHGSPFVTSINGLFDLHVKTSFKWIDTPRKRSIYSHSFVHVKVEPPAPFKYFGKTVLESTGNLAMNIALRQVESSFVSALARDYEKWAIDRSYREYRAKRFNNSVGIV